MKIAAALALLLTAYPLIQTEGITRVSFHAFFQLVLLVGLFSIRRARGWFTVGALLVAPPLSAATVAGGQPENPSRRPETSRFGMAASR